MHIYEIETSFSLPWEMHRVKKSRFYYFMANTFYDITYDFCLVPYKSFMAKTSYCKEGINFTRTDQRSAMFFSAKGI